MKLRWHQTDGDTWSLTPTNPGVSVTVTAAPDGWRWQAYLPDRQVGSERPYDTANTAKASCRKWLRRKRYVC